MSFLNKVFQSIPVKIPDRSGFDLSHEVLSTARTGTVVPITHFEVLPGDTISMGSLMKVTLPPFAVPFMGRIDAELTAAFIPNRLLWQGWQSFITRNDGINTSGHTPSEAGSHVPFVVPTVNPWDNANRPYVEPGSLADYLGWKYNPSSVTGVNPISALPFLAYHKFCDDWIRDDNNMKPFFPKVYLREDNTQISTTLMPHYLPYVSGYLNQGDNVLPNLSLAPLAGSDSYNDFDATIGLGSLRQRCWAKDYFTTATTRPQAGAAASVMFDTSGDSGMFTVSTLRAANSLQKWLERNSIAGTEYGDQIMAHFGVRPPDAVLNRSILLGSVRTPVYVGSVESNSSPGGASTDTFFDVNYYSKGRNPFGNVLGSAAGFGSAADKGTLIDDFTVKEHGFIMVFFTLIPHAYYNTGYNRSLKHISYGDFAWPEFANIGDQEILMNELTTSPSAQNQIFGYNQRYSEYKFLPDRISGELSEQGSLVGLSVYALQRGFGSAPALGKQFLEIPTDFLDDVLALDEAVMKFGCMVDAYFDCQALRVLPEYSLPSLCAGETCY